MGHKGPQGRVRAQVEVGEGPGRADAVPIPKDKSLQNITPILSILTHPHPLYKPEKIR